MITSNPGIYKIVDMKSERFYVGSAANLDRRWRQHKYRLNRGDHPNPLLQAIWNKDPHRLAFVMLEELPGCDVSRRLMVEQRHLDQSGVGTNSNCMNVLQIAGSHEGRKRSAETRRRISDSNKGREFSDEARQRMRAAKSGRKLSDDHKRNIGNASRGRTINRPTGIINPELRALTPETLLELRRRRAEGASWSALASMCDLKLSACRRAVLGITYKDVQ